MRLGALALLLCLIGCAPAWAVPDDDVFYDDDACAPRAADVVPQDLKAGMARSEALYRLTAPPVPLLALLPFKRAVAAPPAPDVFSFGRAAGTAAIDILPRFTYPCRPDPARNIVDDMLTRCGPVSYHMHRRLHRGPRAGGVARLLPPRLTVVRLNWE